MSSGDQLKSFQAEGKRNHKMKLFLLNKLAWPTIVLVCLCVMSHNAKPSECQEQTSSNMVDAHGPQKVAGSPEELVDTLKYLEKLEKLDKYWSEVARPR